MMAMISPALEAMVESLSTLKFANRAKNIKNEPKINEDLDQKSLLRKYERELKRLRAELEEKNKNVVDKRRLLEIDEQRRRAEADKMAAIRALEARSLEFMREKEEKRKLEEEIARLTNQMIRGDSRSSGGADVNGSENQGHAYNHVTKQYQEQMKKDYEGKLAEIERERETIEEEKAQVDRYKQLLLKQRDIMIALTQRLNERDEQIMALQDELDAYDRHQKELEEKLDEKTAQLIHLQRVTLENTAGSPVTDEKVAYALGEWGSAREQALTGGGGGGGATAVGGGDGSALNAPSTPESAASFAAIQSSQAATTTSTATSPNPVSSDQLIETKQFYPFKHPASSEYLLDATTSDASPSKVPKMLDATEKIQELETLLLAAQQEQVHTGKQLEEVQAEKVSMEYLLRENSVHQQELQQATAVSDELNKAKETILLLEKDMAEQQLVIENLKSGRSSNGFDSSGSVSYSSINSSSGNGGASGPGESGDTEHLARVNERCDTLVKERKAIKTIMESKVKVLVNSVAQSTHAVLNESQGIMGTSAGQALAKDMAALKRLVHAAVTALANADAAL